MSDGKFSLNNDLAERDHRLIKELMNEFHDSLFKKHPEIHGKVVIDDHAIIEIVERVHAKKYYYSVFHNIRMGKVAENKTIGLFIYWILKLRPIQSAIRIKEYDLNELFARFIFNKALKLYEGDDFAYDDYMMGYFDEVTYSFKYRELSKESIILMLEYSFHKYRKRTEHT